MSRLRLPLMIGVAMVLGALRWWSPPGEEKDRGAAVELVPAVTRQETSPGPANDGARVLSAITDWTSIDVPGNAFAARVPPSPPMPPPPPPPPFVKLFVGPPAPPPYVPPPPPPLQVVGTWDDGRAPGVFIASPHGGTVLARVGTVLMAEYTITSLTPQHVAVTHTASKLEWRLPIPRAGSHP